MGRKRLLIAVLLCVLLAAMFVVPGIQMAGGVVERLTNGSFEEGFSATPAGSVGNGWTGFDSGGGAKYGFYPDTWAPVVADGATSQLVEINTVGLSGEGAPHYAGIYQTVSVVPGTAYDLTLRGMLRALEEDPDRANYSYRVQYGIDYGGGTAWQSVSNWIEIPWDTVYPRLSPGAMQSYSATVAATGPKLTLFVRVWYKWATTNCELDVNLDAISLKGALPKSAGGKAGAPGYTVVKGSGASRVVIEPAKGTGSGQSVVAFEPPAFPVEGWQYQILVTGVSDVGVTKIELYDNRALVGRAEYQVGPLQLSEEFGWKPKGAGRHLLKAIAYDATGTKAVKQSEVQVGHEAQFVTNGSFEQGFVSGSTGTVGKGWAAFNNGGRAEYGFYDDTWAPVVFDGSHSQLIEINTKEQAGSDPDRYAGISQTVHGLTQGATYRLSLRGMLRVLANDADREGYSYRVEWGYASGESSGWQAVTNWVEVPWDSVYERLNPGAMGGYETTLTAPSSQLTLFVRAWKKWSTIGRELDVNLDAISLKGFKK
jgi:hypothetical protein